MFKYVPVGELTKDQLVMIASSQNSAPENVRHEPADIIQNLVSGEFVAFSVPEGLLIVSIHRHRLYIESFAGRVLDRVELAADLRRLAADWGCDMVSTLVFDPRLIPAIEKVGGRVESYTVVLPVE